MPSLTQLILSGSSNNAQFSNNSGSLGTLTRDLLALQSNRIDPEEGRDRRLMRLLLAPKLHVDVAEGYVVPQGDAAISTAGMITGGLLTCTAMVITTNSHNFLCHADADTKPEWLKQSIESFIDMAGPATAIKRFNCHGNGLNSFSESVTRAVLVDLGLFDRCEDQGYGVTGMHTVGARAATNGASRIFCSWEKP